MAGTWNITVEQGATFTLTCTIKASDGTPLNLTNWTIPGVSPRGQVRKRHRSDDPPIINFVFTINDAAAGRLTMSLTPESTTELSAGETSTDSRSIYVYDFEIQNSVTGEVKRILEGNCYVSPQVTR
jgi:hypothetical protein